MQRYIELQIKSNGTVDRLSSLEKARLKEQSEFEQRKKELEARRQKSSFNYIGGLFEEVSDPEASKESKQVNYDSSNQVINTKDNSVKMEEKEKVGKKK